MEAKLCGEEYERADHLLLHCPRLHLTRTQAFNTINIDTSSPDWEVRYITKFLSNDAVSSLEDPEEQYDAASPVSSPPPSPSLSPSRTGSPRPSTSRGHRSIVPSPRQLGVPPRAATSQASPPSTSSTMALRSPRPSTAPRRAHNISPSPPRSSTPRRRVSTAPKPTVPAVDLSEGIETDD